jgi:alkanesulfonate monooxygenase SsuD/methylene tetrahydromethanopterin reductase-like flavin-dependent oxidoreductase (luciferase family)
VDIGIGLPNTVPGVDRDSLLEYARRAEARGFSSLGTIDRLAYSNYESLIALAAAAAVTERIRLLTDILIVPYRANAALLAKQAATIDHLSGGRLTLGLGVGGREDDYAHSEVDFHTRGRRMDEMLDKMEEVWQSDVFGPRSLNGRPEVLIGGGADAAYRRVARFDGWTLGGSPPEALKEGIEKTRAAWSEAGREGRPRFMALCYFALGENARAVADADLKHYYAWLGDEFAEMIAQSAAVGEDMVRSYRDAFAEAGADELIYFPTSTEPAQVDLLADAVLSARPLGAA